MSFVRGCDSLERRAEADAHEGNAKCEAQPASKPPHPNAAEAQRIGRGPEHGNQSEQDVQVPQGCAEPREEGHTGAARGAPFMIQR